MAWHPGALVIVAPLLLGACVTRAPGETTAGDATETTGGTTSPGSTTTGSPDPTSTSATATASGTTTTGAEACVLVVGPSGEPPEADPDGCFAVADEAGCKAMGDACTALFGVPAECADSQWCVRDREASVFLGCRPFTICKLWGKVVCVADELGTHAFYTMSCTPMGFGLCEPGLDSDGSEPPPACD
ncbi:hypothetical protein OV203_44225 [Nannocystis sp. ILAH1]|uniref:hypothetical protein n=1 Tax=unclassified Nannocystis TaxID=2627009 RepID=UPI00226E47D8|nr:MULTISPECIES: hypothetical protein [unclassified Nannocystis]MCY0994219.1 hypothetical protein [Nannocystis sp. ILAH1]MCY1063999.1 hypothetical protein [Nannocystis sp. RBIL2]